MEGLRSWKAKSFQVGRRERLPCQAASDLCWLPANSAGVPCVVQSDSAAGGGAGRQQPGSTPSNGPSSLRQPQLHGCLCGPRHASAFARGLKSRFEKRNQRQLLKGLVHSGAGGQVSELWAALARFCALARASRPCRAQ